MNQRPLFKGGKRIGIGFPLGILIVIFCATGFSMLPSNHIWGDDFAGYMMQARSIVTHTMDSFIRANAFTINNSSYTIGPVTYPWGFPVLLAPVYLIFGLNIVAYKLVLVLCYALFLIVFFYWSRMRLADHEALILTAFMAFPPAILNLLNQIFADIPFLLFSTLSILLIERFIKNGQKILAGIPVGIAIFYACFIRSIGGLLLFVLIFTQLYYIWERCKGGSKLVKELKLAVFIPYLVFSLLMLLQDRIFPSLPYPLAENFWGFSLNSLFHNIVYYFWMPTQVFPGKAFYLCLLIFFMLGCTVKCRHNFPVYFYVLSTMAFYILYPGIQGLRYILPVLPILALFIFIGMKRAIVWLKKDDQKIASVLLNVFWIGFALIYLSYNIYQVRMNIHNQDEIAGPYSPYSSEMFTFIRQKIPVDRVVIFFKPRVPHMLTGRSSFMTEKWKDISKGDYLVIDKTQGNYCQVSPVEVACCNTYVKLSPFFENAQFTVYKIN